MSIYNLENQTSFNYYVKHRANLLRLSDREYANKYFLIGGKVNKKEQMFSKVMLELLCTENCELINYINDKLSGKFEKKLKPIKLVDSDVEQGDTYNVTQIIDRSMIWNDGESKVSW
jgi:hypothetical protein